MVMVGRDSTSSPAELCPKRGLRAASGQPRTSRQEPAGIACVPNRRRVSHSGPIPANTKNPNDFRARTRCSVCHLVTCSLSIHAFVHRGEPPLAQRVAPTGPKASRCGPGLALTRAHRLHQYTALYQIQERLDGDFSASASASGNRPHSAWRVCDRSRARRSTRRDRRGPAMGTRGGSRIVDPPRRRRVAPEPSHSNGSTGCELNAQTAGTESLPRRGHPRGSRIPQLRRRLRRSWRL